MLSNLFKRLKKEFPGESPAKDLEEDLSPRNNQVEIKDGMQRILDSIPKVFNKRLQYMPTEYKEGFMDLYEAIHYFYKKQPQYNLNIALEEAKKRYFEEHSKIKAQSSEISRLKAEIQRLNDDTKLKEAEHRKEVTSLKTEINQLKQQKTPKASADQDNQRKVWEIANRSTMTDKEKIKQIRFYIRGWAPK